MYQYMFPINCILGLAEPRARPEARPGHLASAIDMASARLVLAWSWPGLGLVEVWTEARHRPRPRPCLGLGLSRTRLGLWLRLVLCNLFTSYLEL